MGGRGGQISTGFQLGNGVRVTRENRRFKGLISLFYFKESGLAHMAKDGTNRGGARIGAGGKKKLWPTTFLKATPANVDLRS